MDNVDYPEIGLPGLFLRGELTDSFTVLLSDTFGGMFKHKSRNGLDSKTQYLATILLVSSIIRTLQKSQERLNIDYLDSRYWPTCYLHRRLITT